MVTARVAAPPMLEPDVRDARAWRRDALNPSDWLVPLSPRCLDELDAVARAVRDDPLPPLMLTPEQFRLDACAQAMTRVREMLRTGIGLAVLDRVPVERYAPDENRALAWLLGSLLGRLVAQKWDGTMLYDVKDTGKALEYGVRRSVTNLDLVFHTDAAWLDLPPELVGLYCINPAREGGVSRFVSLVSVHNEMARRHPALLARLYRAVPWDRQAEHAPGDTKISRRPVFSYDGGAFMACVNEKLIETGAELAGEPLDVEVREALAAMREILDSPELAVQLTIQRGQVQLINNRAFAHARTDFTDATEPQLKRHMIRLWTRQEGRRTFHG
jgi:alpha-ketoglutarate-dependent taurine dioxygenase